MSLNQYMPCTDFFKVNVFVVHKPIHGCQMPCNNFAKQELLSTRSFMAVTSA